MALVTRQRDEAVKVGVRCLGWRRWHGDRQGRRVSLAGRPDGPWAGQGGRGVSEDLGWEERAAEGGQHREDVYLWRVD